MYQVADDLSDEIVITHDVILCCLAISNICQNAQCLKTNELTCCSRMYRIKHDDMLHVSPAGNAAVRWTEMADCVHA